MGWCMDAVMLPFAAAVTAVATNVLSRIISLSNLK